MVHELVCTIVLNQYVSSEVHSPQLAVGKSDRKACCLTVERVSEKQLVNCADDLVSEDSDTGGGNPVVCLYMYLSSISMRASYDGWEPCGTPKIQGYTHSALHKVHLA